MDAGIAASAVGTGVSMMAASQQAAAQQKALQYQAAVAQQQQQAAKQQADAERAAGDAQAQTALMKAGQEAATIRAVAGASGVDPNTGTPVALQSDTEKLGTLEALTIRWNAERRAYADEVTGTSAGAQSQLDLAAARNVGSAGTVNMFSSLLSGASSVSSKWAQYQKDYG